MTYLGSRDGYRATESEVAALPDYREAMKTYGMYTVPPGTYRYEHRVGVWKIVDVAVDPQSRFNRENYSDVQLVKEAATTTPK